MTDSPESSAASDGTFVQLTRSVPHLETLASILEKEAESGGALPLLLEGRLADWRKYIIRAGFVDEAPLDHWRWRLLDDRLNRILGPESVHRSDPWLGSRHLKHLVRRHLIALGWPNHLVTTYSNPETQGDDDLDPAADASWSNRVGKFIDSIFQGGGPQYLAAFDRIILSCLCDEDESSVVEQVRSTVMQYDVGDSAELPQKVQDVLTGAGVILDTGIGSVDVFVRQRYWRVLRDALRISKPQPIDVDSDSRHSAELRICHLGVRAAAQALMAVSPEFGSVTQEVRDLRNSAGLSLSTEQIPHHEISEADRIIAKMVDGIAGGGALSELGQDFAWRLGYSYLMQLFMTGQV